MIKILGILLTLLTLSSDVHAQLPPARAPNSFRLIFRRGNTPTRLTTLIPSVQAPIIYRGLVTNSGRPTPSIGLPGTVPQRAPISITDVPRPWFADKPNTQTPIRTGQTITGVIEVRTPTIPLEETIKPEITPARGVLGSLGLRKPHVYVKPIKTTTLNAAILNDLGQVAQRDADEMNNHRIVQQSAPLMLKTAREIGNRQIAGMMGGSVRETRTAGDVSVSRQNNLQNLAARLRLEAREVHERTTEILR